MLEIKDLSIEIFPSRQLVSNLTITINEKDKLAIIGEEGNGKSTLLKCIYDKELILDYANVTGNIIKKNLLIGYLEQFIDHKWNDQTIEEYLIKKNAQDEPNYEKYNSWYELKEIFKTVDLPDSYLEEPRRIDQLSGGEKVKLQIAKLLFIIMIFCY